MYLQKILFLQSRCNTAYFRFTGFNCRFFNVFFSSLKSVLFKPADLSVQPIKFFNLAADLRTFDSKVFDVFDTFAADGESKS